jgi:hypothetical protein
VAFLRSAPPESLVGRTVGHRDGTVLYLPQEIRLCQVKRRDEGEGSGSGEGEGSGSGSGATGVVGTVAAGLGAGGAGTGSDAVMVAVGLEAVAGMDAFAGADAFTIPTVGGFLQGPPRPNLTTCRRLCLAESFGGFAMDKYGNVR